MARDNGAPAGKGGRGRDSAQGSSRNRIENPEIGDRIAYRCPFCRKDDTATYRRSRDGDPRWFVKCPKSGCEGQDLPSLALELGLHPAASPDDIVAEFATLSPPRGALAPEPLPSESLIEARASTLQGRKGRDGRRYLAGRGISLEEMCRHQIGWDGTFLTFPMRDRTGKLAAYKTRLPRDGARIMKPSGSGAWTWPLYPLPDPCWTRVMLVEGEIDALRLRSIGVPATSVTGGVDHWRDEWTDDLKRLRVVVAFDVGFDHIAAERASRLRDAGVTARAIDLRNLDHLTDRNDDLSNYLDRGGSPDALHRLLAPRIVRRKRSAA